MPIILFKTTIVWLILLLAYFILLSREKAPHWNRVFLWLALISGITIPFIENPFLSVQTVTQAITPANNLTAENPASTAAATNKEHSAWDWHTLLSYLWFAGAAFQAFLLLSNAGQLYFLKKFSRKNLHPIATFYSNKNTPAAFSFGKLIYLPEADYAEQDLRLILQHEQQHAQHKHWIDNLLLELLQIIFWFHPLFYSFKKQIKLVHEYEVDQTIDVTDQYDYAKLLLMQSSKSYTDKLIHTFNFSPLKKRITMMTNTKKVSTWKYLLTLPAIALCFGLMSASPGSDQRVRNGNITTFRGNSIEWLPGTIDTIEIIDPVTGGTLIQTVHNTDQIIKVNGHKVTKGGKYDMGKYNTVTPELAEIKKNIEQALLKNKSRMPANVAEISIQDLVIDKHLNVYYYDVFTSGKDINDINASGLNKVAEVNKIVDELLNNKKLINPRNKKLDKDYYTIMTDVHFSPAESQAQNKNPEDAKKINGSIQIQD
ncbi:MAG: M56 family metallopeptidase [Sphingobacteriales bacterium]|nr:MAG: M56 family metallopeptidase [Sphingobacteriales bacterium]